MDDERHRRMERMYHAAPINRYFEPRMRIGDGTCEVEMDVRPDMFHAANALHGVGYMKLLDDACFFAANSNEDVFMLTARLTTDFLKPVSGGRLRAVAHVTGAEGRRVLARGDLFDASGVLVGRAEGSFARSRIRLDSLPGFR